MMKKWLGVFIVCVLVFALAACGNTGNGSNNVSAPEASSTPAEPGGATLLMRRRASCCRRMEQVSLSGKANPSARL